MDMSYNNKITYSLHFLTWNKSIHWASRWRSQLIMPGKVMHLLGKCRNSVTRLYVIHTLSSNGMYYFGRGWLRLCAAVHFSSKTGIRTWRRKHAHVRTKPLRSAKPLPNYRSISLLLYIKNLFVTTLEPPTSATSGLLTTQACFRCRTLPNPLPNYSTRLISRKLLT